MPPNRKGALVYCSWAECGIGYPAGIPRPSLCPKCARVTVWTTIPPYKLTVNDKRFLKSLRIEPME